MSSAPPQLVGLRDPIASDPAITGHKAARLAQLGERGLPVAPGFVVTTRAFTEICRDRLAGSLHRLDEAAADDGEMAAVQAAIQRDLTSTYLPADLQEAIAVACRDLDDAVAVAARSSCTAEDLEHASFAGLYASYLNIRDPETLLEHIVMVWASAFSPHAVAYRLRHGMSSNDISMAVLVQPQLQPDAAGVLFTRDPLAPDSAAMVVNATFGLGEGVVSGEVGADRYELTNDTGSIAAADVAHKPWKIDLLTTGTGRVPVPAERQDAPCLDADQLGEVARLGRDVRAFEGKEQDIEFAVVGNRVILLQARDIATDRGATPEAALDQEVSWDGLDAESTWVLWSTNPSKSYERDLQRVMGRHAKELFDTIASPMGQAHDVAYLNGYGYFRLPDVPEEELEARRDRHAARMKRYRDEGRSYYDDEIEPEVLDLLANLGGFRRPKSEPLTARIAHLQAAQEAWGRVMGNLHWHGTGGGNATEGFLVEFEELTGRPAIEAADLLQAVDNQTTRMVRRLRKLARIVRGDATLAAVFRDQDYGRLAAPEVRDRPSTKAFRRRFNELLRRNGRRTGMSFGSSTPNDAPTWNLDPTIPLGIIGSYAEHNIDALVAKEREGRRKRLAATKRIAGSLPSPAARDRFTRSLRAAHAHVRFMEDHNHIMEQGVGGVAREALAWVGEGLRRAGQLADANDVWHLTVADMTRAATSGDDLRPLIAARKRDLESQTKLNPPRLLGKPPRPRESSKPKDEVPEPGDRLTGVAASAGVYRGPARVVKAGTQPPTVRPGEILVAANAGQDWTPIMPILGAIVLDQGAIFQHAALIAREYGLPCVIQAGHATTAIEDGQFITVDGSKGTVTLAD